MSDAPKHEVPSPLISPRPAAPQVAPAATAPPAPAAPPQQVVVYHAGPGALGRLSHWLGWTGFLVCGLALVGMTSRLSDYFDTTNGIEEKFVSGESFADDKVAVIDVSGVIVEGEGFVKHQIDRVRKDKNVKAVVVRVDSPGGTVTGSDYIFHHLKQLRAEKQIPMVVSMGSMAASGGYYVSMAVGDQEQVIYAEPTTTTGSIGVIIPHYDLSGLLARFDVKDDSIASHDRKQMLAMTRPISPEHREIIQGYVNESFERFKSIVKEGRPVFQKDSDALDQLATGEIFSAEKARAVGLVDRIGFLEDAIARAAELAHLDADKIRVVKFKRPVSLWDLSGVSAAAPRGDLASLMDLSVPRAYYLFTTLPSLALGREGR